MLDRQCADPCITHKIANCSGSLNQVYKDFPMACTGRKHQGVGALAHYANEVQGEWRRSGRYEDPWMCENAQNPAEHWVAECERLTRSAQVLEDSAHDSMPRCVVAHRTDQYVYINKNHRSRAVHQVEQRTVVREIDARPQTLPAVRR